MRKKLFSSNNQPSSFEAGKLVQLKSLNSETTCKRKNKIIELFRKVLEIFNGRDKGYTDALF